MHVEFRGEIRCTPWQLWPFLDDPEKQKLWLTTLIDIVPTSQSPRSVGSTFDMRVHEGRRVSQYEGRVNAYDPPRHVGAQFWGGAFPPGVYMQVDYRVADLKTHCRLEYKAEVDTTAMRGAIKLAMPIARLFTFFQTRYYMRNLQRMAEAAARSEALRTPAGKTT